jgi:cytosine/adenosine deaminase-related metal-dependent hydrolase
MIRCTNTKSGLSTASGGGGHFGAADDCRPCRSLDPAEMNRLRARGVWVTHQPRSNMNNAVGAADVEGMLRLGIPVCLGNDGFSNNMWAEWKTAYLLHKAARRDPRRMNGMDVVQDGRLQ